MIEWTPGLTLESLEQIAIEQALKFYHGNKTQTALALAVSVRTLDNKLEKYSGDKERAEGARAKFKAEQDDYLKRSRGLPRTSAGVLLESATPAVAQHTLPVPKREEVQEVLPRHNRAGGARPGGK